MVELNGTTVRCLTNTRVAVSLINRLDGMKTHACSMPEKAVGGYDVRINGIAEHVVRIGSHNFNHLFVESPEVKQTILATGFLQANEAIVDQKRGNLVMNYGSISPAASEGSTRAC